MIYDTNSTLFRSFLKASTKTGHVAGVGGVAKDIKAKGSDGKYPGRVSPRERGGGGDGDGS